MQNSARVFLLILAMALMIIHFGSITVLADEEPYIDESYYPYVQELAKQYGICPELICSIIWHESRWQTDAENNGSKGLMQINEKWHQERMERLGVTDLLDTEQNILVGINYLVELFEKYEDNYLVLMVYNMGAGTAVPLYESGKYSYYATSVTETSITFQEKRAARNCNSRRLNNKLT